MGGGLNADDSGVPGGPLKARGTAMQEDRDDQSRRLSSRGKPAAASARRRLGQSDFDRKARRDERPESAVHKR